ncbi:glycoside hydrolase family 32 protein [Xylona heveae TC161]|uniref:Glycoside hydrolase family 32 protein n=1 Tax=Xylona heveae (strain CBS 132557 / TC161) TaxID=1328760 RepID=A0A165GJH9_XYLHT|nr:glycoside hydrolase family 32 protein [Xylona heveae TC161]KZF22265.1 glycoside hydrolase family 32 protein [Xylona heveae TC161]
MKTASAAALLLVGQAACAAVRPRNYTTIDYNLAPPNLSTLANSSLYDLWRPKAHVLPPSGNVGDPCVQYTDPKTGSFHVGWIMSQGLGGAMTDDLIHYQDLREDGGPIISPGGVNDPVGVFDGSVFPSGIDGMPTLLYTSVSFLPIHWTIPYPRGGETQSLAVSYDGGRNFTKLNQGPVIPDAPFGVNRTGFRDPWVFQNSKLDAALDSTQGAWYVVVSGGVHDDGPSQFLYRQYDPDLQYWEYLGQWWHEPANSTWGDGTWAGRWGFNFETGNIFNLNDEEGSSPDDEVFVTLGTEWSYAPAVPEVSANHDQLWAAGKVSKHGNITFTPTMAGTLDWGISAYAGSGKEMPSTSQASTKAGAPDRFISWVWLSGNSFGMAEGFPAAQQNWTGSLLLPRELSLRTIPNVVKNELVHENGSSWRVAHNNASSLVQIKTLGVEIANETYNALVSGPSYVEPGRNLSQAGVVPFNRSPSSKFQVISANISFPQSARHSGLQSGFQILSSNHESTTVYYQFSNESIIVDRSNTSAAAQTTDGIETVNEAGRLRLFDVIPDGAQQKQIETLELTLVVDNAVLEVYANGRFALSTWARSWYANSTDISFFHNGVKDVTFGDVTVSEGLYDAWPARH